MDDCIFCKIAAGKVPAKKLGEKEGAVAFPDIKPEMPVHILVIPKRHVASLDEVGDGTVMGPVFALAAQVARGPGFRKTGWWGGSAGPATRHTWSAAASATSSCGSVPRTSTSRPARTRARSRTPFATRV